jgi:hypothetical protein
MDAATFVYGIMTVPSYTMPSFACSTDATTTISGTLADDAEDAPVPTLPALASAGSWRADQRAMTFCGARCKGTPCPPILQEKQRLAISEIHQNKSSKGFLTQLGATGWRRFGVGPLDPGRSSSVCCHFRPFLSSEGPNGMSGLSSMIPRAHHRPCDIGRALTPTGMNLGPHSLAVVGMGPWHHPATCPI